MKAPRRINGHARVNGKGVAAVAAPLSPASADIASADTDLRLIAFYLPQFHPIAENDKWWGQGFTEWPGVAAAQPLFQGHYQPHIPADLGFYDLRLPEARAAQAELARLRITLKVASLESSSTIRSSTSR